MKKKRTQEQIEKSKEYHKEYFKKWRLRNIKSLKEKARNYNKEYIQRPEVRKRRSEYNSKYRKRPEVRARRRKYEQRLEVKERRKRYEANPLRKKRIKEYFCEYYRRPEVRKRRTKKVVERCKVDINFRLTRKLRDRVYQAVVNGNGKKLYTTKELIGCSVEKLREHLENQFKPGMNWDNHSRYGWHIDHIIPCASYDLTDPQQQKECFHYTNLQPLWAHENLSKGSKIPEVI